MNNNRKTTTKARDCRHSFHGGKCETCGMWDPFYWKNNTKICGIPHPCFTTEKCDRCGMRNPRKPIEDYWALDNHFTGNLVHHVFYGSCPKMPQKQLAFKQIKDCI